MIDEDMKNAWNGKPAQITETEYRKMMAGIIDGRKKTALEKLKTYYKRFSIVGLLFAIIVPFQIMWLVPDNMWLVSDNVRLAFAIALCVYFATASVMDFWLYGKLSEIDIFTMKVGEVAQRAMICRRRHRQFSCTLIPCAVVLIVAILYVFLKDIYLFAGVICGAIIGLVFGLRAYLNMMRSYKDIV